MLHTLAWLERFTRALALGGALLVSGCIGNIRETTTTRTSTEMLLVSTAAERAVTAYDASSLRGRRVVIDDSRYESIDKAYVLSALRDHLAAAGVILVAQGDTPGAELILEIRNGSLGCLDNDFVLGIPSLPLAFQGSPAILTPPLYLFRRDNQQGWAKLQFWVYDPATKRHVSRSGDLWANTYYIQWWWFGIGPFDGSNDVYPELDLSETVR